MFFLKQDRANTLFKQVHEGKALKGRSNDAIASACMYIACRQEGVPRTFKGKKLNKLFTIVLKLGKAIFQTICIVSPVIPTLNVKI